MSFARLAGRSTILVCAAFLFSTAARASTFVYVSNAEDGDISTYRLATDTGQLQPGARVKAAAIVMPMAVSADKKVLYAAARSKPTTLYSYAIDRQTGALTPLATSPLPGSMVYLAFDKTGRYLFADSYGENLVAVSPVEQGGRIGPPAQVLPVGRNPHSLKTDHTNRFAYVPHLATDQILEFTFDAKTGRLTSNTPPLLQMKPATGPRHFVISADNRFMYLLSELVGTVTTLSIDPRTGLLTELGSVSGLPPDTKLVRGRPRLPASDPLYTQHDAANDIWAADLHLRPDGRFLFMSERTSSVLSGFRVDAATGGLTYLGSTPTEKQPRGFAIDPKGRWLVAAGEKSDTISIYAIDRESGALQPRGKAPAGKGANWVEIVEVD